MRALVAVSAAVAALVATGTSAGGSAGTLKCKPGVRTVGSATYRVFCGPASATVRFGGRNRTLRNGRCLSAGTSKVFTLSIGTLTISGGKPRYSYLGIVVPGARRDGVYRRASVSWAHGGKRYSLYNVRLRLTANRSRGTFSGRVVGARGTVSGSFRCR